MFNQASAPPETIDPKSNTLPEKCWKEIGVFGNATCEKLNIWGHCRHCPEYSKAGRKLLDRPIPKGLVKEWTSIFASEKEVVAPGTTSVIVFRLKSEWLAFKTIFFQEAVEVRPVHSVPFRTNNVFRGLVNVNGELLICISAIDLLGIQHEEEEVKNEKKHVYKRMVVVNKDGQRFVFPVDEFIGILRISQDLLQKAPATLYKSPNAISAGIFPMNSRNVGLIDEDKFFHVLKRSLVW